MTNDFLGKGTSMRRYAYARISSLFGGLLLALVPSPAPAAPFSNGGFESGSMPPWIQNNYSAPGINWNVTDSVARAGTFSMTSTGSKELHQTFDGISTRAITQLSFYARHDNATGGDLAVTLIYADRTESRFSLAAGSSTDWVFFDITSRLLARKLLTDFGISGIDTGCPVSCAQTWIDDVVIVQVPEPNALFLLGLGLAGLSWHRSRFREDRPC